MDDVGFTIDELAIPAAAGAPGWDDFAAQALVRNTIETDGYGTAELNLSAEEQLPVWLNQVHEPMRLFVARVGRLVVARALYETLPDAGSDFAWLLVQVLPA